MKCLMRTEWVIVAVAGLPGCAVGGGGPGPAADPDPSVTTVVESSEWSVEVDSARALAEEAIRAGVAGLAVAVIRAGRPVWVEGWGYADLDERRPVEPERSLFRVYSVSKPMTAAAAARVMERGRLDPDAPVSAYVEAWESGESGVVSITAMHLANHTSGIRHYADEAEARSIRHCGAVADAFPIFADDELLHEPGGEETYSSWGYVLLSAVIEGAAGESFMAAMTRLVFDPAGMTHTTLDDPTQEVNGRVTAYEEVDAEPRPARPVDNTCKWGAGGLVATAPDVARFGQAMMDGSLLSPATLQLFLRGDESYRAQGVGVGGTAFLVMDTARDLSIAVLANTSGEAAGPALQRMAEGLHELFNR